MKAAVLHAPNQPLTIEEVGLTKPESREVLLRTAFAGLCHSDLHFIEGLYPHPTPVVLGHESAGIVEAVGDGVSYVKPGDHVITCLSVFCGTCPQCVTGHPNLCENTDVKMPPGIARRMTWKGGHMNQAFNLSSFAEQMLVHENSMVKIDPDVPLDRAALVGCGVMTGVGAVFNAAKVEPGATVAVIGCGGVGLSAVNGAALAGAERIIAIDTVASKLEIARELGATDTLNASNADPAERIIAIDTVASKLEIARELGATDTLNASNADPVQQVRELTGGGVHYSFEALGTKSTAEQAFGMLRPGGTATIIGMVPFGVKIELHGYDFLRDRKLQGTSMGGNRFRVDMPRLLSLWRQGRLKLDHLISGRLKLDQINDGFAALKSGAPVRQLIDFAA
jgi:S-(hydroxymethyl)glutathione dehydrogenase/alcohol dehydrogenase